MISDALELRVEGGQVIHRWRMCIVSHSYGWLGAGGMEVVDGMHAEQSQWVVRMSGDARALPECEVI